MTPKPVPCSRARCVDPGSSCEQFFEGAESSLKGLFGQCEGIDWKEWSQGTSKLRIIDVADGDKALSMTAAVKALKALAGVGQSVANESLKPDGRFSEHLSESGVFITFKS